MRNAVTLLGALSTRSIDKANAKYYKGFARGHPSLENGGGESCLVWMRSPNLRYKYTHLSASPFPSLNPTSTDSALYGTPQPHRVLFCLLSMHPAAVSHPRR